MIQIHEGTFVKISLGLLGAMTAFVFAAGMAYAEMRSTKAEVLALRADFNKYVIDKRFENKQVSTTDPSHP